MTLTKLKQDIFGIAVEITKWKAKIDQLCIRIFLLLFYIFFYPARSYLLDSYKKIIFCQKSNFITTFRCLTMDEGNLFDQVYELGEVISSGPHSELRRCRKIG